MSEPDTSREVVIEYRGRTIRFEPIGGSIEKRLRTGHFYEEQLLQYIESLGLDGTYLDVGSFVGTHALFFAAYCPAKRVHAFEPRRRYFETLGRHVARNDLADRIELHAEGVSDREESVPVVLDGRNETIVCRTLDELIHDPVSLMKIDVEGMEEKVLAGATRILRESKPLLFIEANTLEELRRHVEVLATYGYAPTGRVFNASPTYEYAAAGSPTAPPERLPRAVALPASSWVPDHRKLEVTPVGAGSVRIRSTLSLWQKEHVTQSKPGLKAHPLQPLMRLEKPQLLFLQLTGRLIQGMPVAVFVMEYDRRERTAIHKTYFRPRTFWRLELRPDTIALRVAFRISGPCELELEQVTLHAIDDRRRSD